MNALAHQEYGFGPTRPHALYICGCCHLSSLACSRTQCYLPFFFLKLMAWSTFWRLSSWFLRSILSYSSLVMKPINLLLGLSGSGSEGRLSEVWERLIFIKSHKTQSFLMTITKSCSKVGLRFKLVLFDKLSLTLSRYQLIFYYIFTYLLAY